ncbi:unnamed protein product, partial [marine sediment metagenome]
MVRGFPDYSPGAARSEQGEFLPAIALAPTWFIDDFESPILKWAVTVGTGALDSTPAIGAADSPIYNGSTCLKITGALGGTGQVTRYIVIPSLVTRHGISLVFRLGTLADFHATDPNAFVVLVSYHLSNFIHIAGIGYNPNTGIWSITTDLGATWIPVLTYRVRVITSHYLKLVYDMDSLTLAWLYVDHNKVDLRAYAISSA